MSKPAREMAASSRLMTTFETVSVKSDLRVENVRVRGE